ncbi:MAG: hypothetical protein AB7M05_05230 [Alphaproteobacteria bacterium]
MDRVTIRYSVAAAAILVTVTVAVSAFAESGQYQPPARPVDPNARLPGVIQLEQFLNKNGVTGLNNVRGRPAPATPPPSAQPAQVSPPEPVAQPAEPPPEPVVLSTPPVADRPAPVTRRETTAPTSAQIPMSSSAGQALVVEDADADTTTAVPAQDAETLYAPPVRPPWWERLLSSRGFLYTAAFCLIVVPAAVFAASAVMGRRREERDMMLYD